MKYFPDGPIRLDQKWLPEEERGQVKELEFGLSPEEQAILQPRGELRTMKHLKAAVRRLDALLVELSPGPPED